MPETGPRSIPKSGADATRFPAAVVAVCVPWPIASRALPWNRSAADEGVVGVHERAPADQLVVAGEVRPAGLRDVVSEGARARVSVGGGGGVDRCPSSASIGCSGQTPVSMSATITPRPPFPGRAAAGAAVMANPEDRVANWPRAFPCGQRVLERVALDGEHAGQPEQVTDPVLRQGDRATPP